MKVPLLDLAAQYASIKPEIDAAIDRVVASQRFVLGPVVQACEEAVAAYVGSAHGIGVSSGTDALLVALMAEDIGPGDEVVTTPFSFFATAGAIARVGATPVFVDIDPATFNIDPTLIEDRITARTRAILPVHLFGQMAEMTPIMEIARRRGLAVIEDAAQAIGARHDRHGAGTVGHYGCFSFYPTKNLGGYGDGGIVVTDDPVRAEKLRALRVHGETAPYHHRIVGGNFRLDALQAAVIHAKLPHLDRWTDARIANAALYRRLLGGSAAAKTETAATKVQTADGPADADALDAPNAGGPTSPATLVLPQVLTERHVFNQFVVRVSNRDRVQARLAAAGIGTAIYYPVPLHLQECFAELGYRAGDLPNAERAANEVLALPIFPELTARQIRYVAQNMADSI